MWQLISLADTCMLLAFASRRVAKFLSLTNWAVTTTTAAAVTASVVVERMPRVQFSSVYKDNFLGIEPPFNASLLCRGGKSAASAFHWSTVLTLFQQSCSTLSLSEKRRKKQQKNSVQPVESMISCNKFTASMHIFVSICPTNDRRRRMASCMIHRFACLSAIFGNGDQHWHDSVHSDLANLTSHHKY